MKQSFTRFLGGSGSGAIDATPVWTTSASLPTSPGITVFNQTFAATSPISAAVTYAVVGSLPTGFSMSGDTISGIVSNPPADETRTFTLRANTGTLTVDRTFSLPVTHVTTADPYAENVVFLYNLNGNYSDASVHARNLSTAGTTANGGVSTAQKKFGSHSLFFNGASAGAGCHIRVPASPALLIPASTDFCFEFWMRAGVPQNYGCMMVSASAAVGVAGTGEIPNGLNFGNWTGANGNFSVGTAKTSLSVFTPGGQLWTTSNPNDNTWHHVAVVRSSGTLTLYFDGVSQGPTPTYTGVLDFGQTHGFILGRYLNLATNNIYNGYYDDIRLTVGVSRYTSNFTPPTAEFPYP